MPAETINVFCPTCNVQVNASVVASGHGGYTSTVDPFEDMVTEYHGDKYLIAKCPQCDSPFLFKESRYTELSDMASIHSRTLIYPNSAPFSTEGVPQSVIRAYEQSKRAFATGSYDASALMCRRTLEALCNSLSIQKGSLSEKLQALAKDRIIEARLLDWAHGVRVVGNEAAHDTEAEISKDDARDAIDFIEALLTYVFVLNSKFATFSARRKP